MVKYLLFDIEGTTTDINFVHQVLFPYSAQKLPDYISKYQNDVQVQACLANVANTILQEEQRTLDLKGVIAVLLAWIKADRKHIALKTLQGLIWEDGYKTGAYQAHVYDDVLSCLKAWKEQGLEFGIYSSGSVAAQKLLFQYTIFGDLTSYFSHYFDTHVGGKREVTSYQTIVDTLGLKPTEILFLSDAEEELHAASEAGLQVIRVNRSSQPWTSKYRLVENFQQLTSDQKHVVH